MAPNRTVAPSDEEMMGWIRTLTRQFGGAPSVRELAAAVGLASPSSMHRHLCHLRDAGLVTWVPGRLGTLRVVEPPDPPAD